MRILPLSLLLGALFAFVSCVSAEQTSQVSYKEARRLVTKISALSDVHASTSDQRQGTEKLFRLFQLITNRYYRPLEVEEIAQPAFTKLASLSQGSPHDFTQLLNTVRKEIMQNLDHNSTFYTAEEYAAFRQNLDGNFGGVGAFVRAHDLGVEIDPMPSGAAAKAGIKRGDIIVRIGAFEVHNVPLQEAVKRLRGKVGTNVSLTVKRLTSNKKYEIIHFSITRSLVHQDSVLSRTQENVGILRIFTFNEETDQKISEAIQKMEKQPLAGYILDLRGNLGGLLKEAVRVSDYFLDQGLIVGVRGRYQDEVFSASSHDLLTKRPVVILIDRATASSSEIVAAALSAHNRARLMGEKSFGKGTVQTLIGLHHGEGLRLTTAQYFSPKNIDIEGKGIAPDVHLVDNPDTEEDELVQAAIDILKSR